MQKIGFVIVNEVYQQLSRHAGSKNCNQLLICDTVFRLRWAEFSWSICSFPQWFYESPRRINQFLRFIFEKRGFNAKQLIYKNGRFIWWQIPRIKQWERGRWLLIAQPTFLITPNFRVSSEWSTLLRGIKRYVQKYSTNVRQGIFLKFCAKWWLTNQIFLLSLVIVNH